MYFSLHSNSLPSQLCTTGAILLLQIRGFWAKPLSFDQHSYLNTHRYCLVANLPPIGFIYGRDEPLFDEWYYQCNLSGSAKMGKGWIFIHTSDPVMLFCKHILGKLFVHGQFELTTNLLRTCNLGFHERGQCVDIQEIQPLS